MDLRLCRVVVSSDFEMFMEVDGNSTLVGLRSGLEEQLEIEIVSENKIYFCC